MSSFFSRLGARAVGWEGGAAPVAMSLFAPRQSEREYQPLAEYTSRAPLSSLPDSDAAPYDELRDEQVTASRSPDQVQETERRSFDGPDVAERSVKLSARRSTYTIKREHAGEVKTSPSPGVEREALIAESTAAPRAGSPIRRQVRPQTVDAGDSGPRPPGFEVARAQLGQSLPIERLRAVARSAVSPGMRPAAPEQVVRITIGRVEVRAAAAEPSRSAPRKPETSGSSAALAQYLSKRPRS